jgi:hypothetical protein
VPHYDQKVPLKLKRKFISNDEGTSRWKETGGMRIERLEQRREATSNDEVVKRRLRNIKVHGWT